jgi:hypothetical protein
MDDQDEPLTPEEQRLKQFFADEDSGKVQPTTKRSSSPQSNPSDGLRQQKTVPIAPQPHRGGTTVVRTPKHHNIR